ncbi:MAG: hypothetical protein OER89_10840 [Gemmatimonadota bacterium]|nr:hypothetical protein [Gemmatimonadota bacterium]
MGLEAHPALRSVVEKANEQARLQKLGKPGFVPQLSSDMLGLMATMMLLPGASAPGQVARFGPRVRPLIAGGVGGRAIVGALEERLSGTVVSRVARRAAEDAARFGYLETAVAPIQEESLADAAARQRGGLVGGAVAGGGFQMLGEASALFLKRLFTHAMLRNARMGRIAGPQAVTQTPRRLPAPTGEPAPRPKPEAVTTTPAELQAAPKQALPSDATLTRQPPQVQGERSIEAIATDLTKASRAELLRLRRIGSGTDLAPRVENELQRRAGVAAQALTPELESLAQRTAQVWGVMGDAAGRQVVAAERRRLNLSPEEHEAVNVRIHELQTEKAVRDPEGAGAPVPEQAAARDPRLAKQSQEQLVERAVRAYAQLQRESVRAGQGIQPWTRFDPNIQDQRSGTIISQDARGAMGRAAQAEKRLAAAEAELRARGLTNDEISDLMELLEEEQLTREGFEVEVEGGVVSEPTMEPTPFMPERPDLELTGQQRQIQQGELLPPADHAQAAAEARELLRILDRRLAQAKGKRRQQLAERMLELYPIANAGEGISAEELRTRAIARPGGEAEPMEGQEELFSPIRGVERDAEAVTFVEQIRNDPAMEERVIAALQAARPRIPDNRMIYLLHGPTTGADPSPTWDRASALAAEYAARVQGKPLPDTGLETDPMFAARDPLMVKDGQMPIGYLLRGRTEPPADWRPGDSISRPQVMHLLGKITEAAGRAVPIRSGRVKGRRVAGFFRVGPEVIRTRQADDIATAAHEIGHATEKLVFGWSKGGPWKKPLASGGMQKELTKLGRQLYGNTKPNGGYKREGFAEFWRRWLEEDPTLQADAPLFSAWFDAEFLPEHPEIGLAGTEAKAGIRRWRDQGSYERARMSMVDPASPGERLRAAGESARRIVSMEKLVEMAQPLYELAKEAQRQTGAALPPSDDPYITTAALRTVHAARTKYMVTSGMIDLAGNKVGPPLQDIRGLVTGRHLDFGIYLWARRAIKLWTDPRGPRNPGLSLQDAQQLVGELASPQLELAASKVYDWNAGGLNYAAQASPLFREIVEKVFGRDPGDYIPLQRFFDELDDLWARSAGRAATSRSPVKRLKGSGRRIKDPFPQMITQMEQLIRAAHQRLILDQIVNLARIEGMGHLIEEVSVDQVPVAAATIQELIERINRQMFAADPTAPFVEIGKEGESVDFNLLGQTLTFFAPAQRPKGVDPVLPIWTEEGRVRWYRVDGRLYDALGTLDVYRIGEVGGLPIGEWALGKPAAAFRAGTTGLRASFGLVWNPLRDFQTMWTNSASTANGVKLFWYWLRSMADAGLNRVAGLDTSPWLDAFLSLGGEMAQPLGQDIPHTRLAARRLFQGRVVRSLDPRNWFEWYRDMIQFPEMAPRVAELRAIAEDIGWTPGEPMSLDQSLQLLLGAKQVTTDFTAAGEFGRVINRMVPFHNAAIQGPRANIRAGRRNPMKFVWRGFQLTAATLGLWWLHKDEDWYRTMPWREKFLHWHFPTEWPEPTLIRIPRAFEVGLVFSSLPEAFLDSWYVQDPEGVKQWFNIFRQSATPNVMPVLIGEAFEQLANETFYFDRPIVPMGELRKPAAEQFNEYTSRVAIVLGRTFNISPRRIDHAITGVFGYVAADLLAVLGLGAPGLDREKEAADIPVFGRIFQRGGETGTRPLPIEQLYDLLELAERRQASDVETESLIERQRRLMLTDAAKAVTALSYVRRFTPEADARKALLAEALAIATEAVENDEAGLVAREKFQAMRKTAETRKAVAKGIEQRARAARTGRR